MDGEGASLPGSQLQPPLQVVLRVEVWVGGRSSGLVLGNDWPHQVHLMRGRREGGKGGREGGKGERERGVKDRGG